MRRSLGIIILCFLLSGSAYAFTKGTGEVKMSNRAVNHFIDYVQGKSSIKKNASHDKKGKPSMFILSSNGNWSHAWWCPWTECSDSRSGKTIKECERATGTSCGVFAVKRTLY